MPAVVLDGEMPADAARRFVRSGQWVRIRRGAYVAAADLSADRHLQERQVALARATAVVRQSRADVTFSHETAAVVWGLPLADPPTRTHLVQATRRSGEAADDVARHLRAGAASDRQHVRGLPVTSLARTVVDCACRLGVRGGLVVADAALAAGLDRESCTAVIERMPGARGVRDARTVLEIADDGAESPGESLSRLAILRSGFPPPVTQVAVETYLGTFWLDMGWPEWALGVEFDGAVKYDDLPRDVVLAEKRRQEAIEEAGWHLVRLTFSDLRAPETIAARLLRARRRALAS